MKLSAEHLTALQRFAFKYGRNWKQELNLAWSQGSYEGNPDANLLQQIRNERGPTWLMNLKLKRP
jgi:hypothetical protein